MTNTDDMLTQAEKFDFEPCEEIKMLLAAQLL
jgi:hypothetical protein